MKIWVLLRNVPYELADEFNGAFATEELANKALDKLARNAYHRRTYEVREDEVIGLAPTDPGAASSSS